MSSQIGCNLYLGLVMSAAFVTDLLCDNYVLGYCCTACVG